MSWQQSGQSAVMPLCNRLVDSFNDLLYCLPFCDWTVSENVAAFRYICKLASVVSESPIAILIYSRSTSHVKVHQTCSDVKDLHILTLPPLSLSTVVVVSLKLILCLQIWLFLCWSDGAFV